MELAILLMAMKRLVVLRPQFATYQGCMCQIELSVEDVLFANARLRDHPSESPAVEPGLTRL
jgi:hypothetical protein